MFVHILLPRLVNIFSAEPTATDVTFKYEKLDILYKIIGKFITDELTIYEKTITVFNSFYILLMLKAAYTNNLIGYTDHLIIPFMKVLHRMANLDC